jgi:hypothetical protein
VIEQGIRDFRATGAVPALPYFLSLKAEALHLADRTSEALETIKQAENMGERFQKRERSAELHPLRGVFLTAMGAEQTKIEAFPHSDQNRKGAEVGFPRETRRSNLRGVPASKKQAGQKGGDCVYLFDNTQ